MIIYIWRDYLIAYLSEPQDALCNHESATWLHQGQHVFCHPSALQASVLGQ